MFRHATHLSKPNEQLKILRICLLIPINSAIQFVGQVVPAVYFYIIPWSDMMQSFALGNFFLLMLEFISPHDNQRDFFFSGLQVPSKKSGKAPKDGIKWYRRKWIMVFQYPIVQFVVSIATDVTNSPNLNIYCGNTNKPYFAHLWVSLYMIPSISPRRRPAILLLGAVLGADLPCNIRRPSSAQGGFKMRLTLQHSI